MDLNQDREQYTASSPRLPPPGEAEHCQLFQTSHIVFLTSLNSRHDLWLVAATNVMRHGLYPALRGARVALNPAAPSFAIISSSV